jgi:hypothetical protein
METLVELRNFSAVGFLQSAPGQLTGNTLLTVQYVGRALGPTNADEHLMGNFDAGAQKGWRLRRRAGSVLQNYTFDVYENGALQSLDFSCPAAWGAVTSIWVVYRSGAPGNILAFLNGVSKAAMTTSSGAISPNTPGRFSIGYDVNAGANPALTTSLIGATYEAAVDDTPASNLLEEIKRLGDVTDGGMTTPWFYEYSAVRSCSFGVPTTFENFGSQAPAAALTVINTDDTLIRGTPAFVWNTSTGAGTGGSGPTGSGTDKHIVRWLGTSNIQDSAWSLSDAPGVVTAPQGSGITASPNAPLAAGFTIQTAPGPDADGLARQDLVGGLNFIGGHGGNALSGDNDGGGGASITLRAGDGGVSQGAGRSGRGGITALYSGRDGASVSDSLAYGIIAAVSPQAPYNSPTIQLTAGEVRASAGGLAGAQFFLGQAVAGGGVQPSVGGPIFGFAGANADLGFSGQGGAVTFLTGPSLHTAEFVGRSGTVWIGAHTAINIGTGQTFGNLSGDIVLGLSATEQDRLQGEFATWDGGFLMDGNDGVVYWNLHDISPDSTGGDFYVGTQRVHVMTEAQEANTNMVGYEGFFHCVTTSGALDTNDNSYQYGFRGHRSGWTRSMARIYTREVLPGDIGSGLLTITHNLDTPLPLLQIWMWNGDPASPAVMATQGIQYTAPMSNPADPSNQLWVTFITPPVGGDIWYATVVGY